MRINFKFIMISMVIVIIGACFTGCKNKNAPNYQDDSLKAPEKKDYDICIYNYKDQSYDKFVNLCSVYESETGVKIKVMPISCDQTDMDAVIADMNESQKPDIIPVRDINELSYYKKYDMLLDLNNASSESLKWLINNVDTKFKLTDDKSCYLIPYSICGYGYLVDRDMLSDLFSSSNIDPLIDDLKNSTYSEFENMVKIINNYIKNNISSDVTLNGNNYSLSFSKKGNCKSLIDVFSFPGSDVKSYGQFLSNVALNAVLSNANEAYNMQDTKLNLMKNPLINYAKVIDLETSYTASQDNSLKRGKDFIDENINGYEKSLEEFLNGKSLFLRDGSFSNLNIHSLNAQVYDRLIFIPIKLPLNDEDIAVPNITASDINSSLTAYISLYYGINNNSDDLNKKLSQDFLVWLSTSTTARNYLIKELKVIIPYDYKNSNLDNDTVNSSVLSYLEQGKTLNPIFKGTPRLWANETLAQHIKENYLTKLEWTTQTYNEISDYGINKYNELKNK